MKELLAAIGATVTMLAVALALFEFFDSPRWIFQ